MAITPNDDADVSAASTDAPDESAASGVPARSDGDPTTVGELRLWRAGTAVAVVLVLAAVAVIAVVNRPSNDGGSGSTVAMMAGANMPIAGVRVGCEQWASSRGAAAPGTMPGGTASGAAAPDAAWCASMAAWMTQQVERGNGGPMMWQSADDMATTCRRWMGTGTTGGSMPGGAGMDAARCDEMVTWMAGHRGGWNGWMAGGSMTGGSMDGGSMTGGSMTGGSMNDPRTR